MKNDIFLESIAHGMHKSFASAALGLVVALMSQASIAQINVNVPGVSVNMGGKDKSNISVSVGGKNEVGNTSGHIDESVEIEGVAVINGEVSIDGEKVPKGKTRHTGRKSGIKYVIKWGKDGNVAISQE